MASRIVALLIFVAGTLLLGTPAVARADVPGQRRLTVEQLLEAIRQRKEAGRESRNAAMMTEALEAVQTILERDPASLEANLLAGEILVDMAAVDPRTANFDVARNHLKRVLDIEPSNFRANLYTGHIWNANRSWRQATFYLERAEQVAPDAKSTIEVKQALAIAYAGTGNLALAAEKAAEAVRIDPEDLDALQTLLEIRLTAASRDPRRHLEPALEEAEQYVQKAKEAVERAPSDKATLTRLSQAYQGLLAALRAYMQSLYERDIRNAPTDKLLRGKEAEAAAALHRISRLMREQAILNLSLAEHDALIPVERAVEYEPKNLAYLEDLAGLYERLHFRDKAVEVCRDILAIAPDHERARQFLEALGEPLEAETTESEEAASSN